MSTSASSTKFWSVCGPSSNRLRSLLNREILNVSTNTPPVSLNRRKQIRSKSGPPLYQNFMDEALEVRPETPPLSENLRIM